MVPTMSRTCALLLALAAAWAAAAGPPSPGAPPAPIAGVPPGIVDGATARKLVASGVRVVDVRTPAEFAAGHVPGAVNIPHDEIGARSAELGPPSTPVLLYCRSGRRTAIAARVLADQGFTSVYDMQAYENWTASAPERK